MKKFIEVQTEKGPVTLNVKQIVAIRAGESGTKIRTTIDKKYFVKESYAEVLALVEKAISKTPS